MSEDLLAQLQAARTDEEREWIVLQFSLSGLNLAMREAVWAAAIPHWFDASFLAALLDKSDITNSEHVRDLIALSFVEPFPGRGYNVHERTRMLLLKHLWQDDRERYHTLSQRAADYCARQDQSKTLWRVEIIYHLLITEPDQGTDQLQSAGWEWHNSPNFAYDKVEALARAAREHADAGRLSEQAVGWTTFWEALLDTDYSNFPSAKERFLQISTNIDSNLAVEVLLRLGIVHMFACRSCRRRGRAMKKRSRSTTRLARS